MIEDGNVKTSSRVGDIGTANNAWLGDACSPPRFFCHPSTQISMLICVEGSTQVVVGGVFQDGNDFEDPF